MEALTPLVISLLILITIGVVVTIAVLLRQRPPPPVDVVAALGPGLKGVGDGLERTERSLRADVTTSARSLRDEVGNQLNAMQQLVRTNQSELMSTQQAAATQTVKSMMAELGRFSSELSGSTTQTREHLARMLDTLNAMGTHMTQVQQKQATDMVAQILAVQNEIGAAQRKENAEAATRLTATLADMTRTLEATTQMQHDQGMQLQERLVRSLVQLQESNERKLEQMRVVVDEKLQGTLETRIGEAFKVVSERLELVHRGLGEMQTLATGVGDLQKILSNVKNRGTWGEMQLGQLLQNMLAPGQYAMNVAVRPGSNERVEFAVRMPSHCDDTVWLPIDSKFPLSAWQRIMEASERGDAEATALAERQLEQEVLRCAADIQAKYIEQPYTSDHAILFVPTEALYAEVARRPVLLERLSMDHHVVLAGPTTLSAMLSTLQLAFRTVLIQKRTDDIVAMLGTVKAEMGSFEGLFKKLRKKLQEATNHLDTLDRRHRAMGKALRNVEAGPMLALPEAELVEEEEELEQ